MEIPSFDNQDQPSFWRHLKRWTDWENISGWKHCTAKRTVKTYLLGQGLCENRGPWCWLLHLSLFSVPYGQLERLGLAFDSLEELRTQKLVFQTESGCSELLLLGWDPSGLGVRESRKKTDSKVGLRCPGINDALSCLPEAPVTSF